MPDRDPKLPVPERAAFKLHTTPDTTVTFTKGVGFCIVISDEGSDVSLNRAGAEELSRLLDYILEDLAPDRPEDPE